MGGVSGGAGICTMNFQVPASILPTTLHFNWSIPPLPCFAFIAFLTKPALRGSTA